MSTHSDKEGEEPPHKKARTGVGSSVAPIERGDTDDLILVLSKIKVERLLPRGKQVFTGSTGDLIPTVFQKMVEANVLALPVLNLQGKFYGMIEMFNLVEYVTTLFADLANTRFIDIEKLFQSEKKFTHATVRDIIRNPTSKKNPYKPINKGFSLFTAWEILALSGVERIAVLDESEQMCDLVTQSMLIDFLWQNIEKIGSVADTKIKDFRISPQETMLTVKSNTKTIIAFREMVKNSQRGVAILDDDGKLLDNLSVRDLRGIHSDATVFWRLWSTVIEYKAKVRVEYPKQTPQELIYALPSDTLQSVVEKMAKMHIHRVYVVDGKTTLVPLRAITQTDILREVLNK